MAFSRAAALTGTGTVSCTGTTTVTGTGTNFGVNPRLGGTIIVGGVTKTVTTIASATSLTTDTAFGTFTNQAFTYQKEVVHTGADTMGTGLGLITGFVVTNRGDQQRIFDIGGQDLSLEGSVLTIDATTGQLRNNSFNSGILVKSSSTASAELKITGRKATANDAPFPYPGMDWLGTNGSKIMQLQGTAAFPAKLILLDACIRYGADWITTNSGQYSEIKTEGEICWILNGHGTGTGQARLRMDNTTPSVNFTAKKTYVGVWLNFGVPQTSLKGYTPLNTDGPEINLNSVSVATRIPIEDYDTTYVKPSYYANSQIVLYGGAWVELINNLKGTNINYYSQNASASAENVLEFSRKITATAQDSAGNFLDGGTLYYQPVGANVSGIRPKGVAADLTFDLSQQVATFVDGVATSKFYYAWGYAPTSGVKTTYDYFCTGTTPGAETHVFYSSRYGYDKQPAVVTLAGNDEAAETFSHSSLPTTDKIAVNAAAIAGVTFSFTTKVMDISGTIGPQLIYDSYQYQLNQTANLQKPDECVVSGQRTTYTGWTINIQNGGAINTSDDFKEIGALQVNVETGGVITIPYRDQDGLRVTVTNLDPEGFGITWFLRHRPTGGSTWTNVSGTGNTALILLAEGVYDVQVRAPGYDWESALELDTAASLSLNAGLRFQVSANNTPQHEMPFSETLSNAFQYDAVATAVAVTNETGAIIQPGFAELYRATQRIQHIPELVWTWVAPVAANATSQKILIPAGNPISMFLTDPSDASVKITCPVIYADTGESADDRVRGNPDGFSIILGSPATAESAGLQAGIVAALGGPNYDSEVHSLALIRSVIDLIKTATDSTKTTAEALPTLAEVEASTVLAKEATIDAVATAVDALPDAAVITQSVRAELATELGRIDAAISTRSTLTAEDIPAGLTAAEVRTELAPELDRIDVAVSTRSTLTDEDIPEGLTAAEVWSNTSRTLTESAGLTTEQAAALEDIQTKVTALPDEDVISAQVWDDQPDRLKVVSTVEITGAQIAAL